MKLTQLTLLVLAAAPLAACQQRTPLIELTENGTPYQITLQDRQSSSALAVIGVTDRLQGDLRMAQVEVLNQSAGTFPMRSKCIWFDGDGLEIDSPANAQRLETIPSGATVWLRSVAPSPRAESFRFEISTGG